MGLAGSLCLCALPLSFSNVIILSTLIIYRKYRINKLWNGERSNMKMEKSEGTVQSRAEPYFSKFVLVVIALVRFDAGIQNYASRINATTISIQFPNRFGFRPLILIMYGKHEIWFKTNPCLSIFNPEKKNVYNFSIFLILLFAFAYLLRLRVTFLNFNQINNSKKNKLAD